MSLGPPYKFELCAPRRALIRTSAVKIQRGGRHKKVVKKNKGELGETAASPSSSSAELNWECRLVVHVLSLLPSAPRSKELRASTEAVDIVV